MHAWRAWGLQWSSCNCDAIWVHIKWYVLNSLNMITLAFWHTFYAMLLWSNHEQCVSTTRPYTLNCGTTHILHWKWHADGVTSLRSHCILVVAVLSRLFWRGQLEAYLCVMMPLWSIAISDEKYIAAICFLYWTKPTVANGGSLCVQSITSRGLWYIELASMFRPRSQTHYFRCV